MLATLAGDNAQAVVCLGMLWLLLKKTLIEPGGYWQCPCLVRLTGLL
jgi:hypothetical protein